MTSAPPVERRFGPYGGRYVPVSFIPALDVLVAVLWAPGADRAFAAVLDELLR